MITQKHKRQEKIFYEKNPQKIAVLDCEKLDFTLGRNIMKKIIIAMLITVMLTPAAFAKKKEKQPEQGIQYMNISWWEKYNDPILTEYQNRIYEKNPDLKIASLKVKESEKIVKISFANELPQLSFDGQLNRNFKSSDLYFGQMTIPSFKQSELQLPLTMSYEIDIWGTNRFRTKSIEKRLEMVKQDERASYIMLTSAFAADYFNLIRIDKLLELQKQIVDIQEEIVKKTEIKFKNGLCSKTDLLNEQKALTYLKEEYNNLEDRQTLLTNQLRAYLAAGTDEQIKRSDYDSVSIPQGLPESFDSNVIENRPDYQRAEANIKRAGYNVKVARRDFLPKFVIFGQLGFNAYQFANLFNSPAQMASAGMLPQFDLFTGGRKFAVLKLRKLEYDEAMQVYQKAILTAFQEVNDSLSMAHAAEKTYAEDVDRLKYQDEMFDLLTKKSKIGAASNLEVLYGTQAKLLTEKETVSGKINLLISSINIYKAVGGKDLYEISDL